MNVYHLISPHIVEAKIARSLGNVCIFHILVVTEETSELSVTTNCSCGVILASAVEQLSVLRLENPKEFVLDLTVDCCFR